MQEERDRSEREPLPSEFITGVREVVAEITRFVVFIRDGRNTNAALVVLTLLVAIAAFIQATINGMQLRPLKQSANAAQVASETQKYSFDMERRKAEDQEEAICILRSDGVAALDQLAYIRVINSGKVKARGIEAHVDIFLRDAWTDKKIRDLGTVDISSSELAGNNGDIDHPLNLPLTTRDWQNLADSNQVIINSGHIRYENGFDRVVDEPYCDGWYYFRTPEDKLNPIQGRGTTCAGLALQMAGIRKQKAQLH
jgi:hypothetical protein